MEKLFSVAIDGPSGAGKSTMARAAAERFGFVYVDTGAIYRTVGLAAIRAGAASKDEAAVRSVLPGLDIKIAHDESGAQRMYLGGEDVSELIRTPKMSMYASDVSAMQIVRSFLMDMQRNTAARNSVVMDGRDIGTIVLPNADLKVFLTATPRRRAERRLAELLARGVSTNIEQVLSDLNLRDENDSTRAAAPLCAATDAVLLDTSELTLSESIEAICALISGRLGG